MNIGKYLELYSEYLRFKNYSKNKTMENKTQTAVDWLVRKLSTELIGEIPLHRWDEIRDVVQQALQIEKEQSIECWNTAHQSGRFEGKGIAQENWQTFEQYYNETYGK
jgi:hypothetical protein